MKMDFLNLCVPKGISIIEAMQTMDRVGHKLLIVLDESRFYGLLSIGAIQRALVKGVGPKEKIDGILRKDIIVCTPSDSVEKIRADMLRTRAEFMPIVDGETVVDVIAWNDMFGDAAYTHGSVVKYDLPVVLMAGGEGSRLRPLTNILPKPLLPIGKKTIVETIMDRFVEIGCHRFFISLNYMADTIERYLTEHNDGRYELSFFREAKPMGSGGSLSLIRDKIRERFFVTNCDNVLQQDLAEIIDVHRQQRNEMTVVAAVKSMKLPYGNLITGNNGHGEQVERVEEKPEFIFRINTGVYILEPQLIDEIPEGQYFPITDLMNKIIARNGRIGCFPITDNSWCDIGNWDDYSKVLGRGNND